MPIDPQQDVQLMDVRGHRLGSVAIQRIEGDRVFGRFSAGPDFAAVEGMFQQFEDAVNDQLFPEADRVGRQIDQLGLRLSSADGSETLQLGDVQIMNGSDFLCRIPNLGLIQATRATTHAG